MMNTAALVALLAIAGTSILPTIAVPTPASGITLQHFEIRDIIAELQRRAPDNLNDLLTREGEPVTSPTPTPGPSLEVNPHVEIPVTHVHKPKKRRRSLESIISELDSRDVDDELFTRGDDEQDDKSSSHKRKKRKTPRKKD